MHGEGQGWPSLRELLYFSNGRTDICTTVASSSEFSRSMVILFSMMLLTLLFVGRLKIFLGVESPYWDCASKALTAIVDLPCAVVLFSSSLIFCDAF